MDGMQDRPIAGGNQVGSFIDRTGFKIQENNTNCFTSVINLKDII